MKHTILNCAIAALIALPVFADDKQSSSSSSSSIVTAADGTATITIDVNGKKETKTFKLGGGGPTRIEVRDGKVITGDDKAEKVTYIGIAPGPIGDEVRAQLPLKDGEGIKVNHVVEDSPAAKAGVQEHDILTKLDDQILVEPEQLRSLVKMKKPGEEVKVTLLRKGEQKEVKVVLGESEERAMDRAFAGLAGMRGDALQKRLDDIKNRMPGGVFQRKGIVIGPDGKTHSFDGGSLDDIVNSTRKMMEDAKIPKEQSDSIMETLKGASKGVMKDVLKESKDLRELFGKEKKDGAAPKDAPIEKDGKAEEKKAK